MSCLARECFFVAGPTGRLVREADDRDPTVCATRERAEKFCALIMEIYALRGGNETFTVERFVHESELMTQPSPAQEQPAPGNSTPLELPEYWRVEGNDVWTDNGRFGSIPDTLEELRQVVAYLERELGVPHV